MNKWVKMGLSVLFAMAMTVGCLTGCGSGGNSGAAGGSLIFLIWDPGQKAGMEAMAQAYMEEHPEVDRKSVV